MAKKRHNPLEWRIWKDGKRVDLNDLNMDERISFLSRINRRRAW